MLKLFDVSYEELQTTRSEELYTLRKTTFSDRLGWDVICSQGMESDEFDEPGTRYILGICDGQLVCSVRFIPLSRPNMITHTFNTSFNSVSLPACGTESSRFFVDKARARHLLGEHYPVSQALFIAMINWAQLNDYARIHTIVSRPMLTVLKRSGWDITVLKEAWLTEKERIYLLTLPVGDGDRAQLARKIISRTESPANAIATWPLTLPV